MHPSPPEETFRLFSPHTSRLNVTTHPSTLPSEQQAPDLHLTQALIEYFLEQLNSLVQLATAQPHHHTPTFYAKPPQPEREAYLHALNPVFLASIVELNALLFLPTPKATPMTLASSGPAASPVLSC